MYQLSVSASIKRILETPIGSRVMNPTFGSRIYELVDKRVDDKFKIDFIRFAGEAIAKFERRVKLKRVEILKVENANINYKLYLEDKEIEDVITIS